MKLFSFPGLTALTWISTLIICAFAEDLTQSSRTNALGLYSRDDGCSSLGLSSDFASCGMGLPANFCCNTKIGETCVPFNNNQSVVCCPPGVNCVSFYQLGCNLQGLNVSAPGNANSSIHSTVINGGLTMCSTGSCCPAGMACALDGGGTGICTPSNTTSAPSSTNIPTVTSAGPAALLSQVSTPSPSSSGQATCGQTPSETPSEDSQCPAFPPTAVITGLFPGMIAGGLVTIALIICMGRKQRKSRDAGSESPFQSPQPGKGMPSNSGPTPGFSRKVSEPIMQDAGATRVDFLRRMSNATRSPSGGSQTAVNTPNRSNSARVRSLFSGRRGVAGSDIPEEDQLPQTPPKKLHREPSTETINVTFSPPAVPVDMASHMAGNRTTRWEDVQEAAGLGVKGLAAPPAFLGSPGVVDPRKRGFDGTAKNLR